MMMVMMTMSEERCMGRYTDDEAGRHGLCRTPVKHARGVELALCRHGLVMVPLGVTGTVLLQTSTVPLALCRHGLVMVPLGITGTVLL